MFKDEKKKNEKISKVIQRLQSNIFEKGNKADPNPTFSSYLKT